MDTLEDDLQDKARSLFLIASINHTLSYALTILAAFASIAASLALSLKFEPTWLSAILAAVPAGALIVQNAVKFEDRSRWQWDKSYRIKDLLFQLHEGGDRKEIRSKYLKLNTEALGSLPRFDMPKSGAPR
jgi:hypothetical protein